MNAPARIRSPHSVLTDARVRRALDAYEAQRIDEVREMQATARDLPDREGPAFVAVVAIVACSVIYVAAIAVACRIVIGLALGGGS